MNLVIILMSYLFLSSFFGVNWSQNPTDRTSEKVCIVGKVVRPTDLDFKSGLTVNEAIIAAGGILPRSKDLEVIVISNGPGNQGEITVTHVDLKAIQKKRQPDLKLEPFSIVEVLSRKPERPSGEFVNPCPWVPVLKNRM